MCACICSSCYVDMCSHACLFLPKGYSYLAPSSFSCWQIVKSSRYHFNSVRFVKASFARAVHILHVAQPVFRAVSADSSVNAYRGGRIASRRSSLHSVSKRHSLLAAVVGGPCLSCARTSVEQCNTVLATLVSMVKGIIHNGNLV